MMDASVLQVLCQQVVFVMGTLISAKFPDVMFVKVLNLFEVLY